MTYEPHFRRTFAGIDDHVADPTVPDDYRTTVDAPHGVSADSFPSFATLLGTLRDRFGVEQRPAYYYDDELQEYVQVPNRVVLVNPAWVGNGRAHAPQRSAGWTTASDSYSETDAMDNYGPLIALARQRDYADVFGTVWAYRNGGDVRMDVFFRGLTADDPDTDDPRYVLGFETGYDYFRTQSVTASVIAYDVESGAVLRGLSDAYSSPHRGDIQDRTVDWFEAMFDRAETVGDTLYEVVAEARAYEVDLSEVPLTVADFYEALGFPTDMAESAATGVADQRTPTAWELYEPMTVVLSREYDGKVGGTALVNHASRANNLLYSPASAEQSAYEAAAENHRDASQATLGDDTTAADVLRARAKSLDDAVEQSVSFRERIKTMLSDEPHDNDESPTDHESDDDAASEVDA